MSYTPKLNRIAEPLIPGIIIEIDSKIPIKNKFLKFILTTILSLKNLKRRIDKKIKIKIINNSLIKFLLLTFDNISLAIKIAKSNIIKR